MGRSVHSQPYKDFLALMIAARDSAGLSQVALAERIGRTQSFVSKYERGERRLDVVEFVQFVKAMDLDPIVLLARFLERAFEEPSGTTPSKNSRLSKTASPRSRSKNGSTGRRRRKA